VYVIRVQLSATGQIVSATLAANIAGQDPNGNSLNITTTGPNTSAWVASAPSTSSLQLVYPTSFTGTFTNFRRFVDNAGGGTTYLASAIAVASTTGQTLKYTPGSYTLLFEGFTSALAGINTGSATKLYLAFEYASPTLFF
jgi:hypothetical protein